MSGTGDVRHQLTVTLVRQVPALDVAGWTGYVVDALAPVVERLMREASAEAMRAALDSVRPDGPFRCCPHCIEDEIHDVPRDGHDLPCDTCVRTRARTVETA